MTNWKQYVYVNGKLKDRAEVIFTSEEVIEKVAQMMWLREAGNDITLQAETDEYYKPIRYIMTRTLQDGTIVNHHYVKVRG